MPHQCRCGGAGWDGCVPLAQRVGPPDPALRREMLHELRSAPGRREVTTRDLLLQAASRVGAARLPAELPSGQQSRLCSPVSSPRRVRAAL